MICNSILCRLLTVVNSKQLLHLNVVDWSQLPLTLGYIIVCDVLTYVIVILEFPFSQKNDRVIECHTALHVPMFRFSQVHRNMQRPECKAIIPY